MEFDESALISKTSEAFDFWFSDVGQYGELKHNHGYNSKGYFLFTHILPKLAIPSNGHVMQMGSNFCVSFDILYRMFGDRAIGVDLWNPLEHPKVIEKNIYDLHDINLSFCHIDAGDFKWTPNLRLYSIHYALRNTLKGGIIITAGGNYVNECLQVNLNEMFLKNDYTIKSCKDYTDKTVLDEIGVQHEIIAIKN